MGFDQGSVGVVMVHAGDDAFLSLVHAAQETEPVPTRRGAERRDMEHLVGPQFMAVGRLVQQVTVAFAEGVVDFGDHGAQGPLIGVAVPETHRLEGVAQHARVGLEPGFAGGVLDAGAGEQFVQPGQRATALRATTVAVITVVKAQPAGPVDGQGVAATGTQVAHREHEKKSPVPERVADRAQTPVAHVTEADQRAGLVHAASVSTIRSGHQSAAGATRRPWASPSSCCAACRPAFRPSSWKP